MEDIELMSAIQLGDKIAFRRLWDKYYPSTYRAVLQIVKNPDDTRDILQEAFFRVFRSAKKFDITKKFSSWFYTIVNHVYTDFFKKKSVPIHKHSVWYYTGGFCLFLVIVQVFTGILLLLYYKPTAESAFESVQFIMTNA